MCCWSRPVDHLDLSWQAPRREGAATAASVFGVNERIVVRVNDAEILTEAEISLRVLRGEMSKWRLRLPAPGSTSAELRPSTQDEDRLVAIEKHVEGNIVTWDVSLKEVTSEALRLNLQLRQPRPRQRLGIGPIVVAGTTQRGELRSGPLKTYGFYPGMPDSNASLPRTTPRQGAGCLCLRVSH